MFHINICWRSFFFPLGGNQFNSAVFLIKEWAFSQNVISEYCLIVFSKSIFIEVMIKV